MMITTSTEKAKKQLNDISKADRDGKRDNIGMVVITRRRFQAWERKREREERTNNTRNDDERQVVSVFAPLYKIKIISVSILFVVISLIITF